MQDSFLNLLARHFLTHFGDNPTQCCVVFPNRRASLFFKRELHETKKQAQWLPEIITFQDLIDEQCPNRIIDPIEAQYRFYEVYTRLETEHAETFDSFNNWSPHVMQDFEEIDLYLADARNLYGSVDAAYAMKHWSPDSGDLSHLQEQYLHLWSRMGLWYAEFRKTLKDAGLFTRAMAYRHLAENCELIEFKFGHYIFAGFHAQNESEMTITKHFRKSRRATIIRDYDHFYIDNNQHEAGHFARQFIKNEGGKTPDFTGDSITNLQRNLNITGVAKNIGQTLVAGNILNELRESGQDLSDTAVILCDEQLLMPLLEALPENTGPVNITMGYPLHLLPVSSLFLIILDLQRQASRRSKGNIGFYFKDLLRLFRNPVLISLFNEQEYSEIINAINNDHEFFISPAAFVKLMPDKDIVQSMFSDWSNDSRTASENLIRFGEFLLKKLEVNPDFQEGFEVDNLFEIIKLLRKMNSMQQQFSNTGNLKTFNSLFRQQLRSTNLPFVGEPLEGLQIMGLLEARNLDFKNLIMLSVNENVVPKAKSNNSFIPLDIAVGFGLPTYRDRDSVSAYHFYRLLQKASNVWLIYNTETDEFGKGEKSRYISQIEEEFIHTNTAVSTELFAPEIGGFENFDINFTKSEKFPNDFYRLFSNENSERSLSPTALSTFIDCKLKFFFRYFSEINVPNEKEEDVGADELGNITHEILERLYIPYVDKHLSPADSEEMLARLEEVSESCFEKEQSFRNYEEGPALLVKFGIINSIKRFLQQEYNQLKDYQKNGTTLKILRLEYKLNKNISLKFKGEDIAVRLGGKADRIDLITTNDESYIRIIDYKSGAVKSPDLKFADFEDLVANRKSKLLQLLQYEYMADESFPNHEFKPGIISLRNVSAGFMPIIPADKKAEKFSINKNDLESIFRHLLTQIVNVEEEFEMTEDTVVCSYCEFAGICNRN